MIAKTIDFKKETKEDLEHLEETLRLLNTYDVLDREDAIGRIEDLIDHMKKRLHATR